MKPRRQEPEGSLDSLLDTVTNVVGILVILLAVTQMGVSTAIERIRTNLPDISVATHRKARQEFDELKKALARLIREWEKLKTHTPRDRRDLAALQKQIRELQKRLEREAKRLAAHKSEFERAQRDVEKFRKQAGTLEKQLQDAQAKLAKLKAQLDKTPVPTVPPPTVVHLPDPKAAPKDAKCVWAMCRQGRCLLVDLDGLQDIARDAIRKGGRSLLYRPPEAKRPPPRKKGAPLVFDGNKLVALFKKHRVGTRDFRLLVRAYDTHTYAHLEIVPIKDRGETVEQIRARNSRYRRMAKRVKRGNGYFRFLVWPDGFEAYLMARIVSDAYPVPAGWLPYSAPYWLTTLRGIHIQKLKEPPPRPPAEPPLGPVPPPDVID